MTENATIQVQQDNETENYTVYESADGETIVGMYVEQGIAEQLGEFAAVTIQDAADTSDDATADKKKDTSNYGVFELPPAVTGMYVTHDALDSEEADANADSPSAPENIGLSLAPSDEETFEASLPDLGDQSDALVADEGDESDDESDPSAEEQADALVAGADDDSESQSASETDESDEEEVEIADEEIGIDA